MTELLQAAWPGWRSLAASGKLEGALLAALLFLWVYYKKVKPKAFLIYITCVTVFCILPVTAAALMLYQTRFYDYKWIWSIVPMTAAVAFAVVLLFAEAVQGSGKGAWKKQSGAAALLIAGLIFCGGMGAPPRDAVSGREEGLEARAVLDEVRERMRGREICLWAPSGIVKYARAYDAGVQLLYGRDLWDSDLAACSFDKYPDEFRDLYRWMEAGRYDQAPDISCVETALSAGANCILIAVDKPEGTVGSLEGLLGVSAEKLGDYYLFVR